MESCKWVHEVSAVVREADIQLPYATSWHMHLSENITYL